MSLSSPWWLVLLLAPTAVAAAYVVLQRRRIRTVARFTSVDLLASVAPRRPGWQRHVSAVGMLGALAVLTVALAGPATTQRIALERSTVVLTLDTSASMTAADIPPSRLAAAQSQARDFVTDLPEGVQVGLVTFDTQARVLVPPTADYAQLAGAIDGLQVGAGTATAAGIEQALAQVEAQREGTAGTPAPAAIVLMSDGSPTLGTGDEEPTAAALAAAARAKAAGVAIYTIAFGTADGTVQVQGRTVPVPYDPQTMAAIADASGGRSFTAESADQLREVYGEIGRDVAYEERPVDLTGVFTGVGVALALLACCAALYWNQRVV